MGLHKANSFWIILGIRGFYPNGLHPIRQNIMIEDVLIKVDKFIFPAYFIILDMEEDKEIPIIPGRPFLATSGALIDVQKGELKLRALEDEIAFHVLRPMKLLDDYKNKDTSVLHPKEILQGEVVNSWVNLVLHNELPRRSKAWWPK